MNGELSIVIVSYNTKNILRDCLSSVIKNTRGLDYEIIVIDNASSDGSIEMLKKEFSSTRIIRNKENLGFAKANNQGIRIAKGDNILLLNSDTIVFDNCLYKISEFIKSRSDIGILGCKVLNRDKSLQYSCFHNPTLLTELVFFSKTIIKNFWDPLSYFKHMRYWNHNSLKEVDCLSGCFFWVKKDVFEQVGLLDEDFFMYFEDFEFCRRMKKRSHYKIYYYPEAEIIHLGTMSADPDNYSMIKYCYESVVKYFHKCDGKIVARRFDLLCNFVWRLEMFVFFTLQSNKKFNKKLMMLRELSSV